MTAFSASAIVAKTQIKTTLFKEASPVIYLPGIAVKARLSPIITLATSWLITDSLLSVPSLTITVVSLLVRQLFDCSSVHPGPNNTNAFHRLSACTVRLFAQDHVISFRE